MLGKLFQQGTVAKHCVRKIKSVVNVILRRNLFLSETRSRNNIFVIVKTNVFGVDGGRLVLGLFHISSMSRKENPQKLTQLSSRSHPRHLVGKRTAQKDTITDITSDSQVSSNFSYR